MINNTDINPNNEKENQSQEAEERSNESRQTQVIDGRQTAILESDHKVQTHDRVTETIDLRQTEIIDKNETAQRSKIDVGDRIGSGFVIGKLLTDASGEADIHLCKKDDKTYVAKLYRRSYQPDEKMMEKITSLNSPYVMPIIERGYHLERYFEILPYYREGTLFDNMQKITQDFIKNVVVFEVNEGLKAIHDLDFTHNDIKPHNLFLSDDRKHIIIGDFGILRDLRGRTYVTKVGVSMTYMYAAPEADEATSKKVDYFAFGMTLLHIGFGKDPFLGLSDKKVRMLLINYTQHIPDEIDSQLADLIAKLIKNSPSERLDYEGVNKWIKDNNVYFNARKETSHTEDDSVRINEYRFKSGGTEYRLKDMISLTETLADHWEDAIIHYENFLIHEAIKPYNASLFLELKKTYEHYQNENNRGLFVLLHQLNPKLDFVFKAINYVDFAGFIDHLMAQYPKYDKDVIDKDLLLTVLDGHGNLKKNPGIKNIIADIFKTYQEKDDQRDALVNAFKPTPKIYIQGKVYDTIQSFTQHLFDKKGNAIVYSLESKPHYFYPLFLEPYDLDETKIQLIIKEKDLYKRLLMFSFIVNGSFTLTLGNHVIRQFADLVFLAKHAYAEEDMKEMEFINMLFEQGYAQLIHQFDPSTDAKLITLVASYMNPMTKCAALYFFTDQDASYHGAKTVSDIAFMVSQSEDPLKRSDDIINDEIFYLWLTSKGYQVENDLPKTGIEKPTIKTKISRGKKS